jgi:hypothetical protein
MLVTGNPEPWADAFPVEHLPAVFRVILEEWLRFVRPIARQKLENRITNRFVGHLQREALRKRHPFNFRFRSKLPDPDRDAESGELDIEVFTGLNTEVYFAFECKRLRVSATRSRAEEYVGPGGMGCFITGQYDGRAGCAGMIGYVMDDDVKSARAAVDRAIQRRQTALRLLPPKNLHSASILPTEPRIRQTRHRLRGRDFLICHFFLQFLSKRRVAVGR